MEPALRCFGLFLATMMVVAVVGLFVAYLVAVGQRATHHWYSYTGITCSSAAFLPWTSTGVSKGVVMRLR